MIAGLPDLAGLFNVALYKPATQSSNYRGSRQHGAGGGVNGVRTGGFGFHTAMDPEPWWRLDLLVPTPVRFVVLWNRQDAASDRVRNLVVEASGDGEGWEVLHRTGDQVFGGVRSGTPLVIACDGKVFRFLRLRRTEPGYLHLDEIEVYAAERPVELAERKLHSVLASLGDHPETARRFPREGIAIRWPRWDDGSTPPGTLSLKPMGRFGNHFIQLAHAIHVARRAGIGRIHLDAVNPAALSSARRIGGIEFVPEPADGSEGADLYGRFLTRNALPGCFASLDAGRLVEIGETYLRPMFEDFFPEPPSTTTPSLHVHIRGGDIFVTPHRMYTQPPLSFYMLAVRHAVAEMGIQRVVLVHEDEANPCITALRAWLETQGIACDSQSASVREDLGMLMSAEHLVASRGTFTWPVILLSTRLRTVYSFRRDAVAVFDLLAGAELLAQRGIRMMQIQDPGAAYIPDNRWANTPEQRAMMLDYPEASLRLVEAGEDHTRP